MPRPRAGELRHPVTIQALTQSRDIHGGMVRVWTAVAMRRAKIKNLSGAESPATAQGGLAGEARTEFTVRYLPGVETSMRILYAGRYYNIRHVNDFNEEHRFLIITADTGSGHG